MTTSCNLQTSHVFLSVVPVVIRNGDRRVYTHAFLDSGASCSLITDKLRRELELSGRTVSLSLKTLLDKVVSDTTEVDVNLESLDGHVKIDFKAWTVERLPNLRHKIPATSTLTKWKHLEGLRFVNSSEGEVGLLIGYDVPLAHQVIEQRFGDQREPFANCTPFGWILLGPLPQYYNQSHINYAVDVEDLSQQVALMYNKEFEDMHSSSERSMSLEDRRALEVMERTVTLKNGHYEIALPWKGQPVYNCFTRAVAEPQ